MRHFPFFQVKAFICTTDAKATRRNSSYRPSHTSHGQHRNGFVLHVDSGNASSSTRHTHSYVAGYHEPRRDGRGHMVAGAAISHGPATRRDECPDEAKATRAPLLLHKMNAAHTINTSRKLVRCLPECHRPDRTKSHTRSPQSTRIEPHRNNKTAWRLC